MLTVIWRYVSRKYYLTILPLWYTGSLISVIENGYTFGSGMLVIMMGALTPFTLFSVILLFWDPVEKEG